MSESLQLLNKVQKELLGKAYQEDIWKWHMIYSLCGQMALVSLWDAGEDSDDTTDGCISIRHFKKRISQICHAYSALWLQGKPPLRLEELIYTQYRRSGFLYHRDLYVAAAATQCAVCGKIKLHRGIEPEKQLLMSGLGFISFMKMKQETSRLRSCSGFLCSLYRHIWMRCWRAAAGIHRRNGLRGRNFYRCSGRTAVNTGKPLRIKTIVFLWHGMERFGRAMSFINGTGSRSGIWSVRFRFGGSRIFGPTVWRAVKQDAAVIGGSPPLCCSVMIGCRRSM